MSKKKSKQMNEKQLKTKIDKVTKTYLSDIQNKSSEYKVEEAKTQANTQKKQSVLQGKIDKIISQIDELQKDLQVNTEELSKEIYNSSIELLDFKNKHEKETQEIFDSYKTSELALREELTKLEVK